jgi:hypothetical protein
MAGSVNKAYGSTIARQQGTGPLKITRLLPSIALMLILATVSISPVDVRAATQGGHDGRLYLPSGDALADVDAATASARDNNRLVLVVMGANWCHDSRALASRLQKEPLSSLVNKHYETVFVDVGHLDKGKDVVTRIGPPVYYATPTVLIVDPGSGRLINEQNRHQWAEANNISMEDSVEYFRLMAESEITDVGHDINPSPQLLQLLSDIDVFEQNQADRLYLAYQVLSPMLRAYEKGEKEKFSESTWNEVRDFRYRVPVDADSLRAEARRRVAAGETQINLDYPEYPAFSWETAK